MKDFVASRVVFGLFWNENTGFVVISFSCSFKLLFFQRKGHVYGQVTEALTLQVRFIQFYLKADYPFPDCAIPCF